MDRNADFVAVDKGLREYLLDHEHDIYNEENDYGDLAAVFKSVFFRKPEPYQGNPE